MKRVRIAPHKCGKCPARWYGMTMAHCRACHGTFTGITAFTVHRVGPLDGRVCDFSKLTEVRPGVFGQPSDSGWFERDQGVRE